MPRAIPSLICLSAAMSTLSCSPDFVRADGQLRVIATGLPTGTDTLRLGVSTDATRYEISSPASSPGAELSVDRVPAGIARVSVEVLGGGATLIAPTEHVVNIPAGGLHTETFAFGSSNQDGGVASFASGAIPFEARAREDGIAQGVLTSIQDDASAAFISFLSQAQTAMGTEVGSLEVTAVELSLLGGASMITGLQDLHSEATVFVDGATSGIRVDVASGTITDQPTVTMAVISDQSAFATIISEVRLGQIHVGLRGPTTLQTGSEFRADVSVRLTFLAHR